MSDAGAPREPGAFASHKTGDYHGAKRPADAERERLRLLSAALDPATRSRMDALGIAPGWHCLELGAAEGSMARWMAERVGPSGRVVAGDIDLRFLAECALPNLEVRRLDLRADALEEGAFDLVYCRTLLLHLPEPDAALAKMARALRPGGWLLAEDPDLCLHLAADPDHPDAALFESFHRRLWEHLRAVKRFDTRFGRTLPARLRALGLAELGCDAGARFGHGGAGGGEMMRRSLANFEPLILAQGLATRQELARVDALLADPSFGYLTGLNVAAWGRRR